MKQTIQRGVRGSAPFACSQLVAALALAMPMLSVVQTAHAQAALTPDAAIAHQPGIAAVANGTPIVNIVAPNGAGLSHNKFTDYNVGAAGLILNNSNSPVQTQLGGVIAGNDRLGASPAKVILNEVTGANVSVLNGATEIAGSAARLIVANPNGITANGASFINATRASLVAGNPLFDADGNVAGFQTDKGRIEVQGKGIDARNIDQVDLVARSLLVNADIQAKQLNVVANKGRTQLQGSLIVATPDPETGGALPEVAIDVSALGGMHADSIRLVGKSAGVGVNVAGKIEALTGDIEINPDGKLVVASNAEIAANKGLVINGALDNAGNLHADSISINGSARGDSGSKIAAVENVQINGTANGGNIRGKRIQINGTANGSNITAVEDVQIGGGINGGYVQGNRIFVSGFQISGPLSGSQIGNSNGNANGSNQIGQQNGNANGGNQIGQQAGNANGGNQSGQQTGNVNGGDQSGQQTGNVNGGDQGGQQAGNANGGTNGSQSGNGNVNGGQVEQQAGSGGNGAQPPIAETHPVAPTPGVTPPAQPEPIRVAGLTPDAKVEQQPNIAAVVNGAPVVDIVAPNAAGLSHNKFVDYNVDKAGLILNNSSTAVETQLGGRIAGNAQLGNTPAKVILNEVTGSNESVLNGITEIAGSAARLIVANPNGITANGAGFVNATRATLVAGNPVFDKDGNVAALTTNNGRLVVDRNGLDGSNVDRLDLVAGNIQVNGAVEARKLTAVAHRGTASIDGDALSYASGQWGYDYGRPVAIDVSSSGSVKADSARFVGASALTGVAVDGKISTGAGGLDVVSENSTFVGSRGSMSSDGALSVAGGLFNEGSVRGDTVSVRDGLRTFSSSVTEAGKSLSIDGGVMLGGGALRGDSVSVAGGANVGYGGTIAAQKDLSIKGGLVNQGKIQADTISIAGGAAVGVGGSMKADDALSINGNAQVTRGGTLTAGQKLSIDGGLVTEGAVQARSISVAGGAYVGGYRGASLQADGDLSIKGRANVGNGAFVASGQGLSIGGGLDNQGTVKAGSASIAGGANVGYGASLQTDNALSIDGATNVGYGGAVASGQKLAINGALDNRGSVKAGSVSVAGGATLGFGASLKADGALSIGGDTYAQRNSTLTAGQKMSVGGRFANEGTVQADTISVAQRVDNQAGASMKAVNGLSIGGDVSNQGTLSSDAPVSIDGALFNGWTGVVSSGGKVTVKGGTTSFGRLTENANRQSVSAPGNAGNNSWGYVPMWGGYPFYQGGSPVMMVSSVRLW